MSKLYNGKRAKDYSYSERDMDDLILVADRNAVKSGDMDFLAETKARWKQYGMDMFISERQLKWLERIAGV